MPLPEYRQLSVRRDSGRTSWTVTICILDPDRTITRARSYWSREQAVRVAERIARARALRPGVQVDTFLEWLGR